MTVTKATPYNSNINVLVEALDIVTKRESSSSNHTLCSQVVVSDDESEPTHNTQDYCAALSVTSSSIMCKLTTSSPTTESRKRPMSSVGQQEQQQHGPIDETTTAATSPTTTSRDHPTDMDVLCGRGGLVAKHAGNILYRRLVATNKLLYHTCERNMKPLLAQSIVSAIESKKGVFLKQNEEGRWCNIGTEAAILKTAQALREGSKDARESLQREQQIKRLSAAAAAPTVVVEEADDAPVAKKARLLDTNDQEWTALRNTATSNTATSNSPQPHAVALACHIPKSQQRQQLSDSYWLSIQSKLELDSSDKGFRG